jgi:CRISPR-associated protein Cst1
VSSGTAPVQLTGNPFVDTGLAAAAALAEGAGLYDIHDLTLDHLRQVFGDGSELVSRNKRLKSFTMLFTSNSLLKNPAIKPTVTREKAYLAVLAKLLDSVGGETVAERCNSCGNPRTIDLSPLCSDALAGVVGIKDQPRAVGRDWFPLAGSLGSDAQALPSATQPVSLCAKCLFAVHFLPLAMILFEGRLAVFQCTSVEFWYELVRDIANEVIARVQAGTVETLGSKEGTRAVSRRLLSLFDRLQKQKKLMSLPPSTRLDVWLFTNSGASADCQLETIPNTALTFLSEAVRSGLTHEVDHLLQSEGRREYPFMRCIIEARDYGSLYPRQKWNGVSPKLFSLYQTIVLGRTPRALQAAHLLAGKMESGLGPGERARLRREESFQDRGNRSRAQQCLSDLVAQGNFNHSIYLEMFPPEDGPGVLVGYDGWNLLRFYLHHIDDAAFATPMEADSSDVQSARIDEIRFYAAVIYEDLVGNLGVSGFRSAVLARMSRGRLGSAWLRQQFLRLAETNEGFSWNHWQQLCCLRDGRTFVGELLFQLRLLWIQWLHVGHPQTVSAPPWVPASGLPQAMESTLREELQRYCEGRGLARLHRDVLVRLRQRAIGLDWFSRRLVAEVADARGLTDTEWEDFLNDDEGSPILGDRLFQLHLYSANFYRAGLTESQQEAVS